jgi:hypothetical protein
MMGELPADTPSTGVSAGNEPVLTADWCAALTARWERRWPGVLPIGDELRYSAHDRWVRFHSLPGSKRIPGTSRERGVVLRRHRAVLQELSDGDRAAELVVITGWYSKGDRIPPRMPIRRWLDAGGRHPRAGARWWRSFVEDDSEPDDVIWTHLFAERRHLGDERVRRLLREIAEGDLGSPDAILAPPDLTWLYHPYDGGADVIAPTPAQRDALRDRHTDWLSDHPSGL